MDRETALAQLRARELELRAMGIARLSLFGSTARGEAGPSSDVDLAAELERGRRITAFDFVGLMQHLEALLDSSVDLVSEPARKARLQAEIDRDRVHVF